MTRNQSKHHTAGDWSPSDSKYTHCWRVLEQHTESLQESIYCCSFTGAQCSQADRYSLCFSDKSQNSCSNRSSTGSSLKVCDTAVTDAGYRDLDTHKHVTRYTGWYISARSEDMAACELFYVTTLLKRISLRGFVSEFPHCSSHCISSRVFFSVI